MDTSTTTIAEVVVDVIAGVEAAVILFGSSCSYAAVMAAVAASAANSHL